MKKSKRQANLVRKGHDIDNSIRFEARCKRRLNHRKSEKAGRKANRRGAK